MNSTSQKSNDQLMITMANSAFAGELSELPSSSWELKSVEESIGHKFLNPKLLEEAMTHPSITESPSHGRLQLLGESVVRSAISVYLFKTCPEEAQVQLLRAARAAITSTEKMARSAVKLGLHKLLRAEDPVQKKVKDFAVAVEVEDENALAGAVKAPKVLADIVESVAAAVFVDCGSDMKAAWPVLEILLRPAVTLELVQEQPQPFTDLIHHCHTNDKALRLSYTFEGDRTTANILVAGQLFGSASSKIRYMAKYYAAKAGLMKLSMNNGAAFELNQSGEVHHAKRTLFEICRKRNWAVPTFRTEKVTGPAHDKRFVCSVRVVTDTTELFMEGGEKSRLRDAENSAATKMLLGLQANSF